MALSSITPNPPSSSDNLLLKRCAWPHTGVCGRTGVLVATDGDPVQGIGRGQRATTVRTIGRLRCNCSTPRQALKTFNQSPVGHLLAPKSTMLEEESNLIILKRSVQLAAAWSRRSSAPQGSASLRAAKSCSSPVVPSSPRSGDMGSVILGYQSDVFA